MKVVYLIAVRNPVTGEWEPLEDQPWEWQDALATVIEVAEEVGEASVKLIEVILDPDNLAGEPLEV